MVKKFNTYFRLKSEYAKIFNIIFEKYYDKGYFGDVEKEEIQRIQYEWFCKLINTLENKDSDTLLPYIENHNNKLTRAYFSAVTGKNIRKAKKQDIREYLEGE
jgi:hypothetical protein